MVWARKRRAVKKGGRKPRRVVRRRKNYNNRNTHSFRAPGATVSMGVNSQGTFILNPGADTTAWKFNATTMPVGSGVTTSNLLQATGACAFALNQVANVAQFTSMFDRYKINKIVLKVIPEWNTATYNGGGMLPTMRVCHDYDDSTVPSVGDVYARQNGRTYRLAKAFNITVYPRLAQAVAGLTASGWTVSKPCYLNTANTNIAHYGLKFAIRDLYAPTNANIQIRIEPTYYLTFKDPIWPAGTLQLNTEYPQEVEKDYLGETGVTE